MYICIFVEHETSKEIMREEKETLRKVRNRERNGLTRRKGRVYLGRGGDTEKTVREASESEQLHNYEMS